MSARITRREYEALKARVAALEGQRLTARVDEALTARVAELEKAHKIEDPVKED